ncbi:Integrase [Rhodococcus sp. AW25M09]|nr:Integrase [Rhodococcus sp. AW25M09]
MAFVIDWLSRAIVGWHASTVKDITMVMTALKMALWRRDPGGHRVGSGLIDHSDAGSPVRLDCFRGNACARGYCGIDRKCRRCLQQSGLARSYGELLTLRIANGVGASVYAGLGIAAASIWFVGRAHPLALGIVSAAFGLGVAIGLYTWVGLVSASDWRTGVAPSSSEEIGTKDSADRPPNNT